MWATEGIITDPGNNELLADTGALTVGTFSFTILAWSDVGGSLTLRLRNALNNGDVKTQKITLSTSNNVFSEIVSVPIVVLAVNQRVTLTLDSGFTGTIQCSILAG